MLDRFDDRTLEIVTVIVVILIALVILCYLAIFINPQVVFNPFKPPTSTPIAQVTSIVGPTWTPTHTSTPTNTSTPTPTWTPTATPSNTPTPTSTSTPTPVPPTETPLPTATRRPPPPRPTSTPTPFPYYYLANPPDTGKGPDCTRTWVEGWVISEAGLPEPNVQMRVGNDQGWRADVWTDVNGYYAFQFASGPQAGKFFVRVFKGGQPRSMQFWWETSAGCGSPFSVQHVRVTWRHR
jgi:hypothetical protein